MKRVMSVCALSLLAAACALTACSTTSVESFSSEETVASSQQFSVAYEDHVVPEDTLSNSSSRIHVSLPLEEKAKSEFEEEDSESVDETGSESMISSSSASTSKQASSSSSNAVKEKPQDDVGDYFDNSAGGTKIMGKSAATIDDMVEMYNQSGNTYPSDALRGGGAATIEEFCTIIAREAALEGVRADVVFVQSMHETGWLQFGNQVSIDQFNFAGIGAVDSGGEGAHFKSVSEGIRAQVQHLKAYASTDKLANECVDPRFDLVSRGVASEIRDLSQRWASGSTYGDTLQSKVDDLDSMS